MKRIIIILAMSFPLSIMAQKKVTDTKPQVPAATQPKDTTQQFIISVRDLNDAYNYINSNIYKTGWNNTNLQDVLQLLLNYMQLSGKQVKKP